MTTTKSEQTTPAELLETFKGRSLKSIVIFTVAVHLVVLVATSASYFFKSGGEDTSKLGESERMDIAVREATASLREIAEKHGVKAQDLGSRFADGKPKPAASPAPVEAPADTEPAAPEPEKSAIEKDIEKVEPGPALPSVEDEDLFK
ncbi:hypothetical protein HZ994_12460 [Akkermansiaceae bacterium]|nr:hypothetical protein HZ994_12460 [Akkermansiaceae bacterium]